MGWKEEEGENRLTSSAGKALPFCNGSEASFGGVTSTSTFVLLGSSIFSETQAINKKDYCLPHSYLKTCWRK